MNKTEQLEKVIRDHLERLGFVKTQNKRYDYYRQDPKAGELGLTYDIDKGRDNRTIMATIFMMFSDPKRAKEAGYDCNPYSGKYNYHVLIEISQIDAVFCQFAPMKY